MVHGLATHLETVTGATTATLHELMVFTNRLDAARGQSFAVIFPELAELLASSGIRWTAGTRHAPAAPEAPEAPDQATTSGASSGASSLWVRGARRPREERAPRRAKRAPTAKAAGKRSTSLP